MADLNTVLRDQARASLNTLLDAAVTDGNTEAARKITQDLENLAVSTAPKAPPYGDVEIRAELNKLDWFGVDPKKSGRAIALGRDMDPKKFASAELFTAALLKAVDLEFKPATPVAEEEPEEPGEDGEPAKPALGAKATPRRTDGPGEGDANHRPAARRTSGPWTKLADAPADIQKAVKRSADKFVPASAPKEQRELFITRALAGHYAAHQREGK